MIRIFCISVIAFLFLILSSVTAFGLRCGTHLISTGDTKSEVRDRCGEPTNIEVWQEVRIKRDFYRPIQPDLEEHERYREPFLVKEYVTVEEWVYNFGPSRFIYFLRFENGKLKKITTGDYGY